MKSQQDIYIHIAVLYINPLDAEAEGSSGNKRKMREFRIGIGVLLCVGGGGGERLKSLSGLNVFVVSTLACQRV